MMNGKVKNNNIIIFLIKKKDINMKYNFIRNKVI